MVRLSAIPYPKVAVLLAFGFFVLVGILVVDDYGVVYDESVQRALAAVTAAYMIGADDALLQHRDRTYGVAFELPLLFFELMLGLEDSRRVWLTRHLLSHLFFLVGGLFCYLLVRRMCGSRLLALVAMLLFLLHPRLYAHSFFNTKDVPFLSMFMIVLFLIHRAFRKDDFAAFISCGMAVGVLTNIRILGVMLFAAVLGLRLLDLLQAADWRERKRILATAGLFTAASTLMLYATWPYLWSDPFGHFAEAFSRMADHPEMIPSLFQGEPVVGKEVPPHYVPVWLSITTPPVTLLLGGIGLLTVLRRTFAQPTAALSSGALRFELLLIACFALPVVAVVVFDSNLYNGWRQLYFLHAPLVLLAGVGLHWLAGAQGNAALRIGSCGLAAVGLVSTAASMAFLHPNQAIYFNFLVDRKTPERLRTQYAMDYYETTFRQGLEHLLERHPSSPVYVDMAFNELNSSILPQADRQRVHVSFDQHADFHITNHRPHTASGAVLKTLAPLIYDLKIYNNTVMSVAALDLSLADEIDIEPYRDLYRSAMAGPAIVRSNYSVHLKERLLTYAKDQCRPMDTRPLFILHIEPADRDDLPDHRKPLGFENWEFRFGARGVRFDGKCLATMPLPDYDIARIIIGQTIPSTDKFGSRNRCHLWREVILFNEQQEARQCATGSPACAGHPPMPPCRRSELPGIGFLSLDTQARIIAPSRMP